MLRADRAQQPLETQIREAVGFEELSNLFERVRCRDEIGFPRSVRT